jgi:DNA polymerase III alpha subunit
MATTSFVENIVQSIKQRHSTEVDFFIFKSDDQKIIDAMKQLNDLGRYERDIIYTDPMWADFLNCKSDIMFEEACLLSYYKAEFLAEYLNCEIHENLLCELFNILFMHEITLLPPSVNNSCFDFSVVDDKTLRCGFVCYGNTYIDVISNDTFKNFEDFVIKAINICSIEEVSTLIKSGATDCFGHTRKAMIESFENFTSGQSKKIKLLHDEEFTKKELGLMEFENLNWAYSSSWFLDENTGELIYMGKEL